MKNIIILFATILVLFYSCNKDEENYISTERGTIIGNPVLIGTFSKGQIASTLKNIAGAYAQNFKYNYDVDLYKIDYNTIDPLGKPTLASGLIEVPKDSTKIFSLFSWQHGTTFLKTDAPSHLHGDFQVGLIFAADGYLVACPDYLGLGDGPKLHPYVHAKSEATAVIDMLKATRQFCHNKKIVLNDQLFLAGYSQGGHSTMAALKMIEEQYSDEFKVTACSPMAGPYDLSDTQLKFIMRDKAFPIPFLLPYVLFAYNNVYNMYPDLSSVFLTPYCDEFKGYFTDSTEFNYDVVDNLWPSTKIPSSVLKPEIIQDIKQNPSSPIVLALKENNVYDWKPKTPIHLCHCDGDDIVSYQNSVVAYNSFLNHGSTNVELINPLPGATHVTCAIPSLIDTYIWFETFKQ